MNTLFLQIILYIHSLHKFFQFSHLYHFQTIGQNWLCQEFVRVTKLFYTIWLCQWF
jgi:hypothetical protein